jgi:hypothetical protein
MAEETTRTETGQFARLDQVKDQATYNRVRAAQLAGKDEEEESDAAEEPKQPTGKESQAEYNRLRNEQKNGGGVQKRIDRIVKQRETAREEAVALRERLARYESGEAKPGEEPAAYEPSEQEKTEAQRVRDRHHARIEHARKNIENFEKRVAAAPPIHITHAMAGKLMDLDNGVEVGLYLAEHPELSKDLHTLPTAKAIEAISKIAWKLEMESAQDSLAEKIAAKIPKRYEPIKPLNGGSTKSNVPLDQMSQRDYNKARAAGRIR